ncbi:MAG: leucine-rich repeat protein [Prevotella sp.]|nr:leucine-rich repeat protein [Prevotella sp.]
MNRLILSTLMLVLPLLASAYDAEVDGIYYSLFPEKNEAKVMVSPSGYSGSVNIPEKFTYEGVEYSVTCIGALAFNSFGEYSNLTSVTIPNSVTRIEPEAFGGCSNLTSVNIPNSVTEIAYGAFDRCNGLTSVHITDLEAWCRISFGSCDANPLYYAHHLYLNGEEVKDLVIPNSVTNLGPSAFQGCSGLTSLTIPNSVTSIEKYAFAECSGLTSVSIPSSLTSLGTAIFWGCSNLASVTIPNSVTSIGAYAFRECSSLTSVTIPNSVTQIAQDAFHDCSGLTSVTIGSSVLRILGMAFANCSNLEEVYCIAENVPVLFSPFQNCHLENITLYVPAASLDAYRNAEQWKDFGNIVALPDQGYYPEGTKWTEIRLDTLKYDSWYSKVGDEWVPNFETIEYYVKGEYVETDVDDPFTFKKIYTNGPEWTDSLTFGICEREYNGDNCVLVTVFNYDDDGVLNVCWPGIAYQFDWSVGKGLYFEDIMMSNTTVIPRSRWFYGIIDEIKEGSFGGVRPLKFVDLNGKAPDNDPNNSIIKNIDTKGGRIIQGIGITEWNDGECLFGAPRPYEALGGEYQSRHYRSMLVHFERNGEVLYDVWPEEFPQTAYRPFVEEGKVWKVGDYSGNPVKRVEYYYFDGDTIINGKTCKQMMRQRYVSPDLPEESPSLTKVGAWYEENKKVYLYDSTTKQFKLIYDFSVDANASLQILGQSYLIGPRQTGGIKGYKGVYREVWENENGEETFRCAPWLEGVGGVYGPPTTNVFNVELADPAWFLMSCTVGDEVIYLNDEYEDGATPGDLNGKKQRFDFTHTVKTKPKAPKRREERLRVGERSSGTNGRWPKGKAMREERREEASAMQSLYGEYNEQKLDINLDPLDDAYLVSITDETGKTVYEKAINAGAIVALNIDISSYAEGRYTVTVENSGESFTGIFDTNTTGIKENVTIEKLKDDRIYNLQGQRMSSLRRGVNIVNGRKVYVK